MRLGRCGVVFGIYDCILRCWQLHIILGFIILRTLAWVLINYFFVNCLRYFAQIFMLLMIMQLPNLHPTVRWLVDPQSLAAPPRADRANNSARVHPQQTTDTNPKKISSSPSPSFAPAIAIDDRPHLFHRRNLRASSIHRRRSPSLVRFPSHSFEFPPFFYIVQSLMSIRFAPPLLHPFNWFEINWIASLYVVSDNGFQFFQLHICYILFIFI